MRTFKKINSSFSRFIGIFLLKNPYITVAGAPRHACDRKRLNKSLKKILLMKCTKSTDDMGAPCITPWIQDSIIHSYAFGLIYHVSPYGFLDLRSSFCIYLPICMNCLNVSTSHAATDPRSSFSFYTPFKVD